MNTNINTNTNTNNKLSNIFSKYVSRINYPSPLTNTYFYNTYNPLLCLYLFILNLEGGIVASFLVGLIFNMESMFTEQYFYSIIRATTICLVGYIFTEVFHYLNGFTCGRVLSIDAEMEAKVKAE